MTSIESLTYRPCAGMMVINRAGLVFIGRRTSGPEHIDMKNDWQMPQGGIDEGEDTYQAALRELYEETNIKSVDKLGEIAGWLHYDIPRELASQAWSGKYRGQKQKWYALRFTGKEDEIDPLTPRNGQPAEFDAWRWERLDRVADIVVPFRRDVYRAVAEQFAPFAK